MPRLIVMDNNISKVEKLNFKLLFIHTSPNSEQLQVLDVDL